MVGSVTPRASTRWRMVWMELRTASCRSWFCKLGVISSTKPLASPGKGPMM